MFGRRAAVKTVIGIEGMMCSMCEAHVNDAMRKNFEVRSAKSNRRKKQCVVMSDAPLDEERVRAVVGELGYDVVSVETE